MLDNVRRVTRQVVTYGSPDVALLVVNTLLVPFYTKVLTPEEYGALGILQACEAVLKVIYRWGLDEAFLRLFFDRKDDGDRRTLAGTMAIFLGAANGLILVGLALASGVEASWWSTVPGFRTAFLLLVANSFLSNFFFLPLTLYRAREQAGKVVTFTFTRSAVTIVARIVLVLGFRQGLVGLVLADLLVTCGLTIALWRTYRSMIAWRFSRPLAREALDYGVPHVPYGLFYQAGAYADRALLVAFLPGSPADRFYQLGLYQIATSVANLLKSVPVAFQSAWQPFAFDTVNKRTDAARLFARLATYGFVVLIFLTIALIALTDSLVAIVLPAEYQDTAPIVPILAVGIAAQVAGWFPTTSLNIAKATRYYPIITGVSAVATIAAEFALIPRFGVYGAAFGALIGQFVQSIAYFAVAQRVYPIPYEAGRLTKTLVIGAAVCLAALVVSFASPIWTLLVRGLLIAIGFPAGLFAVRLLTASELKDVRALLQTARSRIQTVVGSSTDVP